MRHSYSSTRLTPPVVLLVLALLASACSEAPVSSNGNEKPIFPLAVGNTWTFRHTIYDAGGSGAIERIDTTTMRVENDTTIRSKRWFKLIETRSGSSSRTTVILRLDSGFLQMYFPNDSTAYPLYKHPATHGEVYRVGQGLSDSITVLNTNTPVSVPAGSFACYEYRLARGHHDYLSPGIGFVKMVRFDTDMNRPRVVWELISFDPA